MLFCTIDFVITLSIVLDTVESYIKSLNPDVSDGYNPCDGNPCMNNGECYQTYRDQYSCDCRSRYTGWTCDVYSKYNPESHR